MRIQKLLALSSLLCVSLGLSLKQSVANNLAESLAETSAEQNAIETTIASLLVGRWVGGGVRQSGAAHFRDQFSFTPDIGFTPWDYSLLDGPNRANADVFYEIVDIWGLSGTNKLPKIAFFGAGYSRYIYRGVISTPNDIRNELDFSRFIQ